MTFAFGQVPLHEISKKHCNFQIFGGKYNGTYCFIKGYYGPKVMATEIQKMMDLTLVRK